MTPAPPTRTRLTREERRARVLDAAAELLYARGVHEVGMDELIRATDLGKATVYRLFPTKDALIGAYLERQAERILASIDEAIADASNPAEGLERIFDAVEADLQSPIFRGCAFNNASVEFGDADHPARTQARNYRAALRDRLVALASLVSPEHGRELGEQLAVLVDGAYVNAVHLGPQGPAAAGLRLARALIATAAPSS